MRGRPNVFGDLFVPSNARADGYYNVDDHGVTYNVYDNDNGVATLMDIKDRGHSA